MIEGVAPVEEKLVDPIEAKLNAVMDFLTKLQTEGNFIVDYDGSVVDLYLDGNKWTHSSLPDIKTGETFKHARSGKMENYQFTPAELPLLNGERVKIVPTSQETTIEPGEVGASFDFLGCQAIIVEDGKKIHFKHNLRVGGPEALIAYLEELGFSGSVLVILHENQVENFITMFVEIAKKVRLRVQVTKQEGFRVWVANNDGLAVVKVTDGGNHEIDTKAITT